MSSAPDSRNARPDHRLHRPRRHRPQDLLSVRHHSNNSNSNSNNNNNPATSPASPPIPIIQSPHHHRHALDHHSGDSDSDNNTDSVATPDLSRQNSTDEKPRRSNTGQSSSRGAEITPEAYAQSIYAHAKRNVAQSIFPGQHYHDLANWLWFADDRAPNPPPAPRRPSSPKPSSSLRDDNHCLAIFVDLAVGKPWSTSAAVAGAGAGSGVGEDGATAEPATTGDDPRVRFFFTGDSPRDSLSSLPPSASEAGAGQLLLLRGCPTPDWLIGLGGKYHIDPEFFHRHLDFFVTETGRSAASLPSLPSSGRNIVQLAVNTVLHSDGTSLPKWQGTGAGAGGGDGGGAGGRKGGARRTVQAQRRVDAEDLEVYRRMYRSTMECGDSIVRDFGTLDERIAIVEQRISICVQRCGDGWIALVWLDAGRPLMHTSTDSWFMESRHREALPVVQHNPRMSTRKGSVESALLNFKLKGDAASGGSSDDSATKPDEEKESGKHPLHDYAHTTRLQQSLHILPFELDTFLAPHVVKTDAFYALHNIFQFAAFSSIQVLNVLDAQIKRELGVLTAEHRRSHILDNLQFVSELLDRHVDSIKNTIHAIKTRKDNGWPSDIDKSKRAIAAARRLETDFDYLLVRALDLRRRCTEGMSVIMNRAVVAESRKGMEQQERLRRLTILATFFIPLSFVTSFFGMNFREFGTGRLSIWLFAAVCVPCLCVVYVAYVWEDKFSGVFRKSVVQPTKQGVGLLGKRLGVSGTGPDQVV